MTNGMAWFAVSNRDRISLGEEFLSLITYCSSYNVWNQIITKPTKLQKETQGYYKNFLKNHVSIRNKKLSEADQIFLALVFYMNFFLIYKNI